MNNKIYLIILAIFAIGFFIVAAILISQSLKKGESLAFVGERILNPSTGDFEMVVL